MATYHSHFGEIDKAFFRKVWCSFFNESQVCQVHPEVRDSRGVTAARPGRVVLIPAHTQLELVPQKNTVSVELIWKCFRRHAFINHHSYTLKPGKETAVRYSDTV